MGNESSSVDADEAELLAQHIDDHHDDAAAHAEADEAAAEFCGFRVLGIQEQSPASRVGFVSFFDFILSANGIRLDTRDSTFMELIAQSEERAMQLEVYNIKSQTTRELTLTPSRAWPGKGLLGVTIRFDSYEHAEDQLLHVLEVVRGSPADAAGLQPDVDYLLGTPERVFRDADDLYDEIQIALEDAFQCYVYNAEEDQVRIVRVSPSESWGGGGVLGAEVGHGVLHRLPSSCRDTIGSSIGFVSLSEEAKAATDPYLRQISRGADTTKREEDTTAEVTEAPDTPESTQENAASTAIDPPQAAAATEEEEKEETTAPVELETALESTSVTAEPTPPPTAPSATSPPAPTPTTPAKPRYAARIDPRFPMSTVAVYADPAQLH